MRISFTGTHGIGKTTLAMWLSDRLGIAYIPEFAREYLEKGFKITTPEEFVIFEDTILAKKIQCEENALLQSNSLIADRSYLDYMVYLKSGLSRFSYDSLKDMSVNGVQITHFFNDYEKRCRSYNRDYDLIFFVTPFTEKISQEFDYREKNPFATNIIQDLLLKEYHEEIKSNKVVLIKEKDLTKRKALILKALQERGFNS